MHRVALLDATRHLPSLVKEAQSGEEIVITDHDLPVAKIIAMGNPPAPRPRFGSAQGLIHIADDFDEPLEDFREYMP